MRNISCMKLQSTNRYVSINKPGCHTLCCLYPVGKQLSITANWSNVLSFQAIIKVFASVTSTKQHRQTLSWITERAFICISITIQVIKVGRKETVPLIQPLTEILPTTKENPPNPRIDPLLWNCLYSNGKSVRWSSSIWAMFWNKIKTRGFTQSPNQSANVFWGTCTWDCG